MSKLILLRHGQSTWNEQNLFTGWVDIPLSQKGIEEALAAGAKIANHPIDVIFTSTLMRAQMTATLAMSVHKGGKVPCLHHPGEGRLEEWAKVYSPKAKASCIPMYAAWQLNERMYGELQGMNKQEMRDKYGADQVQLWRRSYDIAPPGGESLAMTASRTLPYFEEHIAPLAMQGKGVFVPAHGNSLRAIIMHLDKLSHEEVLSLEIATGEPIFYEYSDGRWRKG